MNVDVVEKKVNSETKSSLLETHVYLVVVLSFVQKVRKLLVAMKLFPFQARSGADYLELPYVLYP